MSAAQSPRVLLRLIKERWHADGSPEPDMSRPNQPQKINGGLFRYGGKSYFPGETVEVPEHEARALLKMHPLTIETEAAHQARIALHRQRDTANTRDRNSLDARMRLLETDAENQRKLTALAEERERQRARENFELRNVTQGKDAQVAEAQAKEAEARAQQEAMQRQLAEVQAKLDALLAPQPAPAAAASAADTAKPAADAVATAEATPAPSGRRRPA